MIYAFSIREQFLYYMIHGSMGLQPNYNLKDRMIQMPKYNTVSCSRLSQKTPSLTFIYIFLLAIDCGVREWFMVMPYALIVQSFHIR